MLISARLYYSLIATIFFFLSFYILHATNDIYLTSAPQINNISEDRVSFLFTCFICINFGIYSYRFSFTEVVSCKKIVLDGPAPPWMSCFTLCGISPWLFILVSVRLDVSLVLLLATSCAYGNAMLRSSVVLFTHPLHSETF